MNEGGFGPPLISLYTHNHIQEKIDMAPRTEAVATEEVAPEANIVVVEPQAEELAPVVQAVTVQPTTKSARVKGTWTMYWGSLVFDFVDGERYDLPVDLFEYLKQHSNIYDTL